MKVETLMTKTPQCCGPDDSLAEAASKMEQYDCGSIPVVSAPDQADVVGMVTDRDICLAALHEAKPLGEIRVRKAMSGEVRTISSSAEVEEAERLMARAQVRRLPVVDGRNQLKGLITLGQIARARSATDAAAVAHTVASISTPTPGANAV
jgi:CBS domain-containing protein